MLYSRTLLLIHSLYTSFHLPTLAPQSSPPPSSAPWQPANCSLCPWDTFSNKSFSHDALESEGSLWACLRVLQEKVEGCRTFTLAPSRALSSHLPDSTRVQGDGAGNANTGCSGKFTCREVRGDQERRILSIHWQPRKSRFLEEEAFQSLAAGALKKHSNRSSTHLGWGAVSVPNVVGRPKQRRYQRASSPRPLRSPGAGLLAALAAAAGWGLRKGLEIQTRTPSGVFSPPGRLLRICEFPMP